MNDHFKAARHHVERAAETAREGIAEELHHVETRLRDLVGQDEEPEPGTLEKLQQDLENIEKRAEGEARDALESARQRIADYRNSE